MQMRFRSGTALVAALLIFSPASGSAQTQPPQTQAAPAPVPAQGAPDLAPLNAGQIQRWFEAYTVLQAQDAEPGRSAVPPGRYARIAVSDTGVGMSPETRGRAFEPFFTTKRPGEGTGLGLATVYGIVKQSDGFIWCQSEPGRGTTFEIFLPERVGPPEPVERGGSAPLARGGGETVLVVEDEEAVRRMAARTLSARGYRVLEATDAAQALAQEPEWGPIHLLVTDVVMPGLGGRELASALTARRPGLRVLYISGYTDDEITRRGLLDAGAPFLEKPFEAEGLARRVREVLDGPPR